MNYVNVKIEITSTTSGVHCISLIIVWYICLQQRVYKTIFAQFPFYVFLVHDVMSVYETTDKKYTIYTSIETGVFCNI